MKDVGLRADPISGADLAAFVVAVESGTLRAAADALELTQSAVTKRIQALERRLGARLLERGRFGVRPTELGRALYPESKQALDALQAVQSRADAERTSGSDVLRLIASRTVGELLLPGWLADFRRIHPQVRSRLDVVNSTEVIEAMEQDRYDVGFIEGRQRLSALRGLSIGRDEIVVVVSASHRWAQRRSLNAHDLLHEPYLTRETTSGTREVVDLALARLDIELQPSSEMTSLQSLKRALANGGFTLISKLAIIEEQTAGSLVAIPLADVNLQRQLRAVRRSSPPDSSVAAAFWRWLQRERPATAS